MKGVWGVGGVERVEGDEKTYDACVLWHLTL